jgi:hypothetical protein
MISIWARVLKETYIYFLDIFVQLLYATYACKQHRLSCIASQKIVQKLAFYPNPHNDVGGIMHPVIMPATLGAT